MREQMGMASPETVAMQDNASSPQHPPLPPLFSSGPVIRLKSLQAPKGEVQNVTHEEVCYSPRELLEFFHSYRQKGREYPWE